MESHRLTLVGLAALGVAITSAVLLVTDVLFDLWAAVVVGAAVLVLIVGFWWILPLSRGRRAS